MKKLLTCFMCIMMLVGISGCGSDESKSDKTDKPKTEEKTDTTKKDEGSLAEKKKLKEMAPDPNDMLGDARIDFEEYDSESRTYRYKIDKATDDFYATYIDACENGLFNSDFIKNNADEFSNTQSFESSTGDGKYWIQIIYTPAKENDDSCTNIYIGVEDEA